MGKLYLVSIDGGMPRDAGPDMGVAGSYSPDGTKLAVTRKAQSYWRKYYRGAYQSDVTIMDVASKTFKDVAKFEGMDSWPLWSQDGFIYFVSDREGKGQTNIWRASDGSQPEQITRFTTGDVRFPGMSGDGKTIVFEHDFGIWKLDIASRQVKPLPLEIVAETQQTLTEFRDFNSTVDDYDLAPDGKRIVFSVHGELFTAPTEEGGELRQLTEGAPRDRDLQYSPDGKSIAFISDQTGREEIHVIAADGAGAAKRVTDVDSLKTSWSWSPDSKSIAFVTSDRKLYTIGADGKNQKELASSTYGGISNPVWSPDGKLLAYSKTDVSRASDVYLIPSSGGEEKKITFDSNNESNPRFSADGTKVYFIRREGDFDGETRPTAQIFCVPLEKLTADPDEPDRAPDGAAAEGAGGPEGRRPMMARAVTPKTPKIDWAGLKRRTRQVTRGGSVFTYIPANDGRTLIFAGTEGGAAGGGGPGGFRGAGGGGGGTPSIYTIQDNGKRQTRVASGNPRPTVADGDTPPPRGMRGGGFRGGMSNLRLTKDGRTLFYQEGESVYSTSISGGGGGGGGGFAAAMAAASRAVAAAVAGVAPAQAVRPAVPVVVAGPAAGSPLTSPSGSKSPRNGTKCSTTPGAA